MNEKVVKDTFWERYGHFVGCTVRESNSAVGIVTGVSNENACPMLYIRRKSGKIDRRKPSDVHKTCACGKRALDSNGKVCPGHENCKPLACAPPEPEDCHEPHEDGPLNYCPTCSWQRDTKATDDDSVQASEQHAKPIYKECGCTKYVGHPGCRHDRIYEDRQRSFLAGVRWAHGQMIDKEMQHG